MTMTPDEAYVALEVEIAYLRADLTQAQAEREAVKDVAADMLVTLLIETMGAGKAADVRLTKKIAEWRFKLSTI
jgi:hypothetical protein